VGELFLAGMASVGHNIEVIGRDDIEVQTRTTL
jgi:hypothetical protein